jgi:outer membrane protein
VAQKEIDRQKAGHAPVLSVVGRINRDDEGGSLFGGESDVGTREATLQLTFPIFQGFSVLSKTREAIKLYYAAKADLEREIRGVRRAAKASFLGVKSSIENAEAFRQSVLSNQIALEAKREGFKSGLFPALAVLDAERDLHRVREYYARTHYEYIVHSLRLKKAVGTLNEEDLVAINQWFE